MKRIILLLSIAGVLMIQSVHATLSWTPLGTADASYGLFGMNPIYNYFHLQQSVRVTALGFMEVQPNDSAPLIIRLWRGTPGNLTALDASTIYAPPGATNFALFNLADNGYGGFANGNPITPVTLPPGDYAISAQVVDNTQNLHHFYYATTDFVAAPPVTSASGSSFGSGTIYLGPLFDYEVPTSPPVLQSTMTGSQLELLWPLTQTNAVLQISTNLSDIHGWSDDLSHAAGTNGANYSVLVPTTNTAAFFRLRQ